MYCQLIIYDCSQGAADAEAKLMLARNWQYHPMVLSFTNVLPKTCDAGLWWLCQAIMTSHVGLFSIAKSNDNSAPLYNEQLFLPSIVLSNVIKNIVVLLTSESSSNIIQ